MEHIRTNIQSSSQVIQNLITLGGVLLGTVLGGVITLKITLVGIEKQFENQEKWDRNRRESEIKEKKEYIEKSIGKFLIPELRQNKININSNNFRYHLERYVEAAEECTCNKLRYDEYKSLRSSLCEFKGKKFDNIIMVYETLIKNIKPYKGMEDTLSIVTFNRTDNETHDKLNNIISEMDELIKLLEAKYNREN